MLRKELFKGVSGSAPVGAGQPVGAESLMGNLTASLYGGSKVGHFNKKNSTCLVW